MTPFINPCSIVQLHYFKITVSIAWHILATGVFGFSCESVLFFVCLFNFQIGSELLQCHC